MRPLRFASMNGCHRSSPQSVAPILFLPQTAVFRRPRHRYLEPDFAGIRRPERLIERPASRVYSSNATAHLLLKLRPWLRRRCGLQSLDLGRLGADAFKPKPKAVPSVRDERAKVKRARSAAQFPSHEACDSQMNIKGPEDLLNRFPHIAKRDGLRVSRLLRRALDAYEREQGREAR